MKERSPFDHRPDAALGRVLREALTADDNEAFVARVIAAAPLCAVESGDWWQVLTGWARPAMVAVLLAVTVALALWVRGLSSATDIAGGGVDDPLRGVGDPASLSTYFASGEEPDVDVVLALVLDGR